MGVVAAGEWNDHSSCQTHITSEEMRDVLGLRIAERRKSRGWSQAVLAERARMSERQISRIECSNSHPTNQNLASIADAFEIGVNELMTGRTAEELAEFVADNSCRTCGAALVNRVYVDHEYGDAEHDVYECGATAGWRERPCPRSENFPAWTDYRLDFLEHDGMVSCLAFGKTEAARAVDLQGGRGPTREVAERWVRRSYVAQSQGYSAAEKAFPFNELIAAGGRG